MIADASSNALEIDPGAFYPSPLRASLYLLTPLRLLMRMIRARFTRCAVQADRYRIGEERFPRLQRCRYVFVSTNLLASV